MKLFRKLFHRWVIEKFSKIAFTLTTAFAIAIVYIPVQHQFTALYILIAVLCLLYITIVIYANTNKRITIAIHNTKIVIKSGDLFKEQGSKVIPMNEFYDIDVEAGIIDVNSLHGQYLTKYTKISPNELYNNIVSTLKGRNLEVIDEQKTTGNHTKYKLGTIYDDKQGFLLLAYSRFDNENRAYLHNDDIVRCYANMWNEIDVIRGTKSITLPVLGAGGIVRFDKNYTPQQLIELLLWSFRVSGVQLSKSATLTIVVHESIVKEIDFLKLKNYSD